MGYVFVGSFRKFGLH